jgi:hypothetical protein
MPNKLKEGTIRVSYVESQINHKAISLLAGLKNVNISSLIREAVINFLHREDADGNIRATAKHIIETQSENADERIQSLLNDEVIERLKKIALR